MIILWTDALIWLVYLSLLGFAYQVLKDDVLRARWSIVFQSKLGSVSFIILMMYIAIAMWDSIHWMNDSGEVRSLLDWTFAHLTQMERSYSSPFALESFVKETVTIEGVTQRINPALVHVNPDSSWLDWLGRLAIVVAVVSLGLAKLHLLTRHWQWKARSAAYWTLIVSLGVLGLAWALSLDFHILGTDKVGEDVFYQALKSVRTGVLIGALTTLVMLPIAVFLGISAGYFGGKVDDAIQYLYTTLSSVPGVLLIAAGVLLMQVMISQNPGLFETEAERTDLRLLFLCLILGITSWTGLCRLLRAETLKLRQLDYVLAAQAMAVSRIKVLGRHILPNVTHIILIAVVLDFSGLVLAEAVLSYVGIGVDPSMYSWGNMINSARLELSREPVVWWPLFAAFIFMFGLVLAANVFSDAVRKAFDPRAERE